MQKALPIGNDQFRIVREKDYYYIDKTLLIKEFLEQRDTASLITRPRRFGKTLNMTMLREFFDITRDSREIFKGLAIMDTKYASLINTKPVIYFSFKDCSGKTQDELKVRLSKEILKEYQRYAVIFESGSQDKRDVYVRIFYNNLEKLISCSMSFAELSAYVEELIRVVHDHYGAAPILLIDEYDQPVLSSYENGYRKELGDFFSSFYGSALKGNEYMDQALLTGIQRVAKESIFSKLNNISIYTVIDECYSDKFGITKKEAEKLLCDFNMELSAVVKEKYDGYRFGRYDIYNPWSLLCYIRKGRAENFWVNTSTNYLVKEAVKKADERFRREFDELIEKKTVRVGINLETSFIELQDNYSLWGLLVNAGYVTVEDVEDESFMKVRIPNEEVCAEFRKILAEQANISDMDLQGMFRCLLEKDMEGFLKIYRDIVISCTSYFDAKENAYHMLFLGMCISVRGIYEVSSNLEQGHGRSDITLKALEPGRPHIILEFKQGSDVETLKKSALKQILKKQYYSGLSGEVLCVGIAHDKKQCALTWESITVTGSGQAVRENI